MGASGDQLHHAKTYLKYHNQPLEAIWGDTTQTLNCSGYDHNWVRVYKYADDSAPLLPKGTILHLSGYFNNTLTNPNVADPRNWSGAGHRSSTCCRRSIWTTRNSPPRLHAASGSSGPTARPT